MTEFSTEFGNKFGTNPSVNFHPPSVNFHLNDNKLASTSSFIVPMCDTRLQSYLRVLKEGGCHETTQLNTNESNPRPQNKDCVRPPALVHIILKM